ncbi:MAG TPA: vitamin B12 dependent methionine synthase [Clostridiales bacterium]|nr:vitamin B12 dependent methionine synthase [Clostridiales bacterium]
MKKFIVPVTDTKIALEELLKIIRLADDPDDEDYRQVARMFQEARGCALPKFVYGLAGIEEKGEDYVIAEGHKLVSPLVRRNLDQVNRIVPYVVTCGAELEQWSLRFSDPLEHYWADEIKKLYLVKCAAVLRRRAQVQYFPARDMSHMSPGSLAEWPITAQKSLFALIGDVTRDIGVSLTESCLMIPSKSISGFFFSSKVHFDNCRFCPLLKCPNRQAPYEKEASQHQIEEHAGLIR